MAGVIDNLAQTSTFQPFGEIDTSYYGQTFKAGGDFLQSLDFKINAVTGPDDTEYHVLITTVKDLGGGQFQPGEVLKEVEGFVEPFDADTGLHQVHVNLKGVQLEEGKTYAFILDAFVTRDGSNGTSHVGSTGNAYTDGQLVYFNVVGGTRADHFNANWTERPTIDFAFKAVFSDTGNTIFGTKNDDRIDNLHAPKGGPKATDFDDKIYGKKGDDSLYGGKGFDYLDGGKHKDKLYGGDDGDTLLGGKQRDKLFGGDGEDCFLFNFKMTKKSAKMNFDKLFDFDVTQDAIYLQQSKFPDLALGDLPDNDTHIVLQDGKLYYNGIKFAEFKLSVPTDVNDIHIVVYA